MAAGRVERLQDQIKKIVSEILLNKMNDPNLGFITVTDVEVTSDLKYGKVYYSVYGDTQTRQNTAKALRKARGFVHRELSREIRIKKLPEISFHPDDSLERGLRVQELLEKIEQESDDAKKDQESDS